MSTAGSDTPVLQAQFRDRVEFCGKKSGVCDNELYMKVHGELDDLELKFILLLPSVHVL